MKGLAGGSARVGRLSTVFALVFWGALTGVVSPTVSALEPVGGFADLAVRAEALLRGAGFELEVGDWRRFSVRRCVLEGTQCYGNNPDSNYLFPVLSVPPDERHPAQPDRWHLGQADAVVIVGYTPPPARYFSFTHYLHSRAAEGRFERQVFAAALGGSLDHLSIATAGDSVFSAPFALVLTADADTYERVRSVLSALPELPTDAFNLLAMANRSGLHYGYDNDADDFALLLRIAIADDAAALGTYRRAPPLTAFRLRLPRAEAAETLPPPRRALPGSGSHELDIDPSLALRQDALAAAVVARYGKRLAYEELAIEPGQNGTGEMCILTDTHCVYHSEDAVYGRILPTLHYLSNDPREFILVIGVDHAALPAAKAVYTNHSIGINGGQRVGVAAVNDDRFSGSAAYHSGGVPLDTRYLYAYKFARNCGAEPYCLQVPPRLGHPLLGTGADEPFSLTTRIYLDPHTGVFPKLNELVIHRAFHFAPHEARGN